MPVLMVVIDGMEDHADNGLLGGSFLARTGCQNIESIARRGLYGLVNNTPTGRETDSMVCILTMLGVPPHHIPRGRAYLEALSIGAKPGGEDLVLRCNLAAIDEENRLISSCGAGLTDAQMRQAVRIISKETGLELLHLNTYKNLLIIQEGKQYFDTFKTYPPHQNIGRLLKDIMPAADSPVGAALQKLVFASQKILGSYVILPWGEAVREELPSFFTLHGIEGAMVAKTEIVRGIGVAMGLICPLLDRATGDVDTDLCEKATMAMELVKRYDFVMLHINGADESAHRGNFTEKAAFLKRIDDEVIGPLLDGLSADTALIVTSDHATDCESGAHLNAPVSYYIWNHNEESAKWLK